jgi:hypothetical protein
MRNLIRRLADRVHADDPFVPQNYAEEFYFDFAESEADNYISFPEEPDLIGSGSEGYVFDLRESRVLKITNNKAEAIAMSSLIGHGIEGLVQVFAVFALRGKQVFGIVKEKLRHDDDLSGGLENILREIGTDLGIDYHMTSSYTTENVRRMLKITVDQEPFTAQLNVLIETMHSLYRKNITWNDLQYTNIMFRDSTPVIIELGMAKGGSPDIIVV